MPIDDLSHNRTFWEQKAAENPYWYVSSFGDYSAARDLDSFWNSGTTIFKDICDRTGYRPDTHQVVAEIGCGVGRLTRAIAPRVHSVEAFDLSEKMLEIARTANLPNATFRNGDGKSLQPLADNSADLVLGYCVFQHLPSHEILRLYIQDMLRVAKPGAMIAFTLTPRDWHYYVLPLLRMRSYARERLSDSGPKGTYKHEWTGIRPSVVTVRSLCPIQLQFASMQNDRWLFWGYKPQ